MTTWLPVLYWLSGLTCTDENFMQKAGAQRMAAELGLIIVAPDTSPRGEGVADDANGAYDFGLGAGFYVNARGGSEGLHDGLEGVGRQQRRLIGTGPRNLCHDSPI